MFKLNRFNLFFVVSSIVILASACNAQPTPVVVVVTATNVPPTITNTASVTPWVVTATKIPSDTPSYTPTSSNTPWVVTATPLSPSDTPTDTPSSTSTYTATANKGQQTAIVAAYNIQETKQAKGTAAFNSAVATAANSTVVAIQQSNTPGAAQTGTTSANVAILVAASQTSAASSATATLTPTKVQGTLYGTLFIGASETHTLYLDSQHYTLTDSSESFQFYIDGVLPATLLVGNDCQGKFTWGNVILQFGGKFDKSTCLREDSGHFYYLEVIEGKKYTFNFPK